jgi:tetratricopeptide (TPR) repeat protein
MLTSPADGLLCSVELENGAMIRNPRIYRNGLKFEGKIHEIQNYKSISVYSDFVVTHGRLGGQSEEAIRDRKIQTNDMIPRIMGKQLKEDKTNTRASFHLALHYQTRGEYKKAFEMQKLYFKYAKIQGERWLMYFNKALIHFALNNTLRALWATDDAEKETAGRWEVSKLRGMIFFKDKRYKKAVEFLVNSFDENTGDTTYKPWVRDNSETWNIIGECYFNMGKYEVASEAFSEASKTEKNNKKKDLFTRRATLMKQMSCQK